MLSKDESELFHLANGFAIRHMNREQRGDYDSPTWLRWAFYVYLATLHAILRVEARAAGDHSETLRASSRKPQPDDGRRRDCPRGSPQLHPS